MTLPEIYMVIDAYNTQQKQVTTHNYNLACMIVDFIGRSFAHKDLPSISEILKEDNPQHQQQVNAFRTEQWKVFADKYNKSRNGGV